MVDPRHSLSMFDVIEPAKRAASMYVFARSSSRLRA